MQRWCEEVLAHNEHIVDVCVRGTSAIENAAMLRRGGGLCPDRDAVGSAGGDRHCERELAVRGQGQIIAQVVLHHEGTVESHDSASDGEPGRRWRWRCGWRGAVRSASTAAS